MIVEYAPICHQNEVVVTTSDGRQPCKKHEPSRVPLFARFDSSPVRREAHINEFFGLAIDSEYISSSAHSSIRAALHRNI